jgi:hypothetical protein
MIGRPVAGEAKAMAFGVADEHFARAPGIIRGRLDNNGAAFLVILVRASTSCTATHIHVHGYAWAPWHRKFDRSLRDTQPLIGGSPQFHRFSNPNL